MTEVGDTDPHVPPEGTRPPDPTIAICLSYDQWVHVGAAITHALELDCRLPVAQQHPLVGFWAEMLRELERQIEEEVEQPRPTEFEPLK